MSVKRQATTELNHDNWDDDDPVDQEDLSGFKVASKDILEKRVIRTAKRRTLVSNEQPKKSVFSAFGGFNKQQPTSFDFLSKITNANNENNTLTSKADSSVTSSLFTSKPLTTSPNSGLFSVKTSTATSSQSPFGSSSISPGGSTLFGVSTANTNTPTSIFTSKADSTVSDSPFKIQTVTSSTDNKIDSTKSTISNTFTSSKSVDPSTNSNNAKSTFSTTSSLFQIKPATNTAQSNIDTIKTSESKSTEEMKSEAKNDSKMKYYSKLKHLNESVSEWIRKHVEQTPLCILTPIFKDYEKYIKEIQEEYKSPVTEENKPTKSDVKTFESFNTKATSATKSNSSGSNIFTAPQSNTSLPTDKPAVLSFGTNVSAASSNFAKSDPPSLLFGSTPKTTQTSTTTSSLFSIGTTSAFSFASNTNTITTNGSSSPFSFGVSKPFSFNSNIAQSTEKKEDTNKEEDEDTPPKVEYTPVVEKDSIYDKKCKIFVKKDGNFVDKGVGTLYIKKIEDSEKHQLLVRANTNLGTILVNLILASAIPTQRMGKNNVMMVCIPTADSKPPPTPILIRVKTSEEADELLETLNKYKM